MHYGTYALSSHATWTPRAADLLTPHLVAERPQYHVLNSSVRLR